jgi:hypothetical protein
MIVWFRLLSISNIERRHEVDLDDIYVFTLPPNESIPCNNGATSFWTASNYTHNVSMFVFGFDVFKWSNDSVIIGLAALDRNGVAGSQ